jgi:hypothetical protein
MKAQHQISWVMYQTLPCSPPNGSNKPKSYIAIWAVQIESRCLDSIWTVQKQKKRIPRISGIFLLQIWKNWPSAYEKNALPDPAPRFLAFFPPFWGQLGQNFGI